MPRCPGVKGTPIFPKDFRVNIPYIKLFVNMYESSSDDFKSTKELYAKYVSFVDKQTDCPGIIDIARAPHRFSIQFRKIAANLKWEYRKNNGSNHQRGYGVRVKSQSEQNMTSCENNVDFMEICRGNITKYLNGSLGNLPLPFTSERISSLRYGAISLTNIQKGQVITEYFVEQISQEETEERQQEIYTEHFKENILYLPDDTCYVGSADQNGTFTGLDGTALYQNAIPNCKIVAILHENRTRVFIVACHNIPSKIELICAPTDIKLIHTSTKQYECKTCGEKLAHDDFKSHMEFHSAGEHFSGTSTSIPYREIMKSAKTAVIKLERCDSMWRNMQLLQRIKTEPKSDESEKSTVNSLLLQYEPPNNIWRNIPPISIKIEPNDNHYGFNENDRTLEENHIEL